MRAISRGCLRKRDLFLSTGILSGRTGRRSGFTHRERTGIESRGFCGFLVEMWRTGKIAGRELLNALLLGVPPNQGIEDGEDVPPVFDHAVEDVAELGVALGVAVPLDHDGLGHFDIAAQLLGRMAAQEQTIEKRRFPLGKREVGGDFGRYDELGDRGHEKNAVYRNASPRQVVQTARCGEAGKTSTVSGTVLQIL
jgi:hypothetical protein